MGLSFSPVYIIALVFLVVALVVLVIIAKNTSRNKAPSRNSVESKNDVSANNFGTEKKSVLANLFSQPVRSPGYDIAPSEELVNACDIIDSRFFLTDYGSLVAILRVMPVIRTTLSSGEDFVSNFVEIVKNLPAKSTVQFVQMPFPSRVEGLTDRYANTAHSWLTKNNQAELDGDQEKIVYYNSRLFLANVIGINILDTSSASPRRESFLVLSKDATKIIGQSSPEHIQKAAETFQIEVDQMLAVCQSFNLQIEQMPIEDCLDVLWYAYNPDQGASALRERALERFMNLFERGHSDIPASSGLSEKNITEILMDPAHNLKPGLAPRQVSLEDVEESRIAFPGKTLTPYMVVDYRSIVPSISRLLGDGNRFASKLVISFFVASPSADEIARDTRKASTAKQAVEAVKERLGGTLPSYKTSEEVATIEAARYGAETQKDVIKFLTMYLCLISNESEEHEDRVDFEAILKSLNVNYIPGKWISRSVWQSCIPLGKNYLDREVEGRNVRAADISGLNPVTSLSEFDPGGDFLGFTPVTQSNLMPVAVVRKRGSVIRPGEAIIGAPGSGKSFTLKNWTSNWTALGERIFIIDPKAEFMEITQKIGGEVIELLGGGGFNLFQFDKVEAPMSSKRGKALTDMIWEDNLASLISLYARVKGDNSTSSGVENAILMNALSQAMQECDMDPHDGSTWGKNKIFLTDVYHTLSSPESFQDNPEIIKMMLKTLEPYGTKNGHYFAMFNTPVNLEFTNDINTIVFGTSQFAADPKLNFLAYHFALKMASQHSLRSFVMDEGQYTPYHIVIDEASQILVNASIVGAVAKMLSLFQTYGISLHMAFQDMNAIANADSLTRGTSSGSSNTLSSLIPAYWLFKQEPNSAKAAGQLLNLSTEEVQWLTKQGIGQCILVFTGEKRIPIIIKGPDELDDLFRTDPDRMKKIVQSMMDGQEEQADISAGPAIEETGSNEYEDIFG